MTGANCLIWGTETSESYNAENGLPVYVSPRAGGAYTISRSIAVNVPTLSEEVKSKLTTWLVDRRRMGDPVPMVTYDAIDTATAARPLRTSEKIDRFFLALDYANLDVGGTFRVTGPMDDEFRRWSFLLAAWTEVRGRSGGLDILQLLEDLGLVKAQGMSAHRLSASGYEKMEQLVSGRSQFDQGFVAMWFDPSMANIYDAGFSPGIIAAGYKPQRIDRKEHNNKIDDEIIAEIRRSRFVVADMTCPIFTPDGEKPLAVPRGGVYYEAGFAQGLGIPVIWTTKAGTIEHVHFDTRQYNHITWTDAVDLMEKLKVRIGAVLGYGPHAV